MRDELVLQVAAMKPESEEDLREVRGIHHQVSRDNMGELLEVLMRARLAPKDEWPKAPPRPQGLTPSQESACELLRMLLKQRCEEAHIVPRLLASRDEIEAVIRGDVALQDAHFMHGWRYDVFGKDAQSFLTGKLSVSAAAKGNHYTVIWKAEP
jgi:ribonuclease D